MQIKVGYFCALLCLASCIGSQRSTTATTPTPTTTTPAPCPLPCPQPGVYPLAGVLRASGVPLAGARVGLVKIGIQSTVSPGPEDLIASRITDADGAYSFPRVENVSFSGALVSVSKSGYLIDTKYVELSEGRQLRFRSRASSADAGESSCKGSVCVREGDFRMN